MERDTAPQFRPAAGNANESLEQFVAEAFAAKSGLRFSEMEPGGQRTARHRATTATLAVTEWIAHNVPDAVAPLRAAGLLIWTPDDSYGNSSQ